jgi:hypothetical protein
LSNGNYFFRRRMRNGIGKSAKPNPACRQAGTGGVGGGKIPKK